MGVPIGSRNIFPSNIQGLPTWFEVRVNAAGHVGRRGGIDFMVQMNPQTWDADVKSIEPGGYLFYDSTKPMPPSKFRDDVTTLGVPLTELTNRRYTDSRQRQLFKNIIYVGALAALMNIDTAVIRALIAEQFRTKEKLIDANMEALAIGFDWVKANLGDPCGLKVAKSDGVGDKILIEGNAACGLGAVYGGATVCAWYPITPSTSLAEAFQKYSSRYRTDRTSGENKVAIVQAEDELAAIGMVIGAAWNGSRAFTATSGPGISLMQEFLGLAYFAEVPAVIFDVQRGGPSTGMPTRTQQSDLLICAYASHGDTRHVLLFPEDPRECFEFAALSFDLADRLQTPIFVLLDLDIGMNEWLVPPLTWDDSRRYDRGKVTTYEELEGGKPFSRYLDVDGDAIPYRTYPGTHPTRGAFFTRGTSRNRHAIYSEEGKDYVDNMDRLVAKFETIKRYVPAPLVREAARPTKHGVIYFGSTTVAMNEALEQMAADGVHLDALRLRAYPFQDSVLDFIASHERTFIVEQNRDGQLRTLLLDTGRVEPAKIESVLHYDGTPITARFITEAIGRRIAPSQPRLKVVAS
jgi:2-oxoglutarate ferredoxin oxidoreductase subunit alpha